MNYSGDKKREITEKKKKDKHRDIQFKLQIIGWVDNVLTKVEEFFDSLEEAVSFSNDKIGHVKIYNHRDELIHSEHHAPYHQEKDHHNHGHHGHHGHHDDDYN